MSTIFLILFQNFRKIFLKFVLEFPQIPSKYSWNHLKFPFKNQYFESTFFHNLLKVSPTLIKNLFPDICNNFIIVSISYFIFIKYMSTCLLYVLLCRRWVYKTLYHFLKEHFTGKFVRGKSDILKIFLISRKGEK